MSDEAAFLRAIQTDPTDSTVKLVYADWLDERGEREKAEYLRTEVATGGSFPTRNEHAERYYQLASRHRVWVDLVRGRVPLWDVATMYALGRLEGLLDAFAAVNGHRSDIGYDFHAVLRLQSATLAQSVDEHYPECAPVVLEPFDNWESGLTTVLEEWPGHSRCLRCG